MARHRNTQGEFDFALSSPIFPEIGPWGSHDGQGNWDHHNLIFPVYLKLMTGFPSVYPEDVGAELLH
jgi:hypothetical protein